MKHKKRLILLLLASLCLLALAACGNGGQPQVTATVQVTLIDMAGNQLLDAETSVASAAPNAEEAVKQACKENNIPMTLTGGMFDGFGGQKSTQTDGWLLYINDKQAEKGAADIPIQDGDQIAFRYENYDEAFYNQGE